ncbi:MAG TPA: hypothetical protein VN654_12215 [Vicinamibacterales bacterium]|nr:hypothetical protein [Vicinamibacterales bacterium]
MPTEPDASPVPRPEPRQASWRAKLMAGLIVTSPVGSIVIGVVTGAIFILGVDGVRAVLAGLLVGGASWLVMGVAVIAYLPVDRANRSIHKELMTRMETMRADPMPASAETQLQALAQELGAALSSTASDEERRRLISQLQHPR